MKDTVLYVSTYHTSLVVAKSWHNLQNKRCAIIFTTEAPTVTGAKLQRKWRRSPYSIPARSQARKQIDKRERTKKFKKPELWLQLEQLQLHTIQLQQQQQRSNNNHHHDDYYYCYYCYCYYYYYYYSSSSSSYYYYYYYCSCSCSCSCCCCCCCHNNSNNNNCNYTTTTAANIFMTSSDSIENKQWQSLPGVTLPMRYFDPLGFAKQGDREGTKWSHFFIVELYTFVFHQNIYTVHTGIETKHGWH